MLNFKLTKHPTGRIPPYVHARKAPPQVAYHLMLKLAKHPHWSHTSLCSSSQSTPTGHIPPYAQAHKAPLQVTYHLMPKLTKHPTGRIPPYAQALKAPPLAAYHLMLTLTKHPHWPHTSLCSRSQSTPTSKHPAEPYALCSTSNSQSTPLVAYRLMLTLAKHPLAAYHLMLTLTKRPHWPHTALCSSSQSTPTGRIPPYAHSQKHQTTVFIRNLTGRIPPYAQARKATQLVAYRLMLTLTSTKPLSCLRTSPAAYHLMLKPTTHPTTVLTQIPIMLFIYVTHT
ncbi:uncharacterized protein LACBIDRAFT_325664 [Laccaria bicolor S238N-H82]|uniref:Predicted protein n=1 Tax=Laccaria bicolor (strain S238N-H82 / ATCC MYA-4686) TaxID=486041 RepID=B0D5T4_LACBS|nr:uncharacterized protein LACBIDRAFT_325664 [Laccaria bicolor S238N-H82]EDR09828.1 predicted protein [Laccaria bicolor S238N-H82]|eukprot:XP_001879213.1 predicted protein [Laccaria bicolor S238N-H82]